MRWRNDEFERIEWIAEGEGAFKRGNSRCACPYEDRTKQKFWWLTGFNEAENERV